MTDRFVIDLDDAELQLRIASVLSGLSQPQQPLHSIGQLLKGNIALRFQTKRGPDGMPWLPLARSTAARYAKEDKGKARGSLLQRTGQMLRSLDYNVLGTDAVEIGFNQRVGRWDLATLHELGTQRMPRRPMIFDDPIAGTLGTQDRQDLLDELEAWVGDLLG